LLGHACRGMSNAGYLASKNREAAI
jgi:hypothetical protein